MRVLHISSTDVRGGAARGAYWLHQALGQRGVDSLMLVGRKYSDDGSVSSYHGEALSRVTELVRDRLDPLPLKRYDKTDESFWTVGWLPRDLRRHVAAIDPDVVHLHWTGAGFLPIGALAKLDRPLVWTLRDMWAFTGGCHYSGACNGYETACGRCPQLRSRADDDLSRKLWHRKREKWRGLDATLVPISSWLADCIRKADFLPHCPIEVVPNGLDTGLFHPSPKAEALAEWGLPGDRQYILFGALGALTDKRKGYDQFVAATRHLRRSCWSTRSEVLVFGDSGMENAHDLALPARFLGHIDDDTRLAKLYAAADVMVAPSLQEAFGKTLAEAMACGTPVVAFDGTGPADIVTHRQSGYLARRGDARDLARGIEWCLTIPERNRALGQAARARAREEFDIESIAGRYMALYRRAAEGAS